VELHVCVGRQPVHVADDAEEIMITSPSSGHCIWILNNSVHIDHKGNLVSHNESPFAWQPIGGPQIEEIPSDY